MIKRICFWCIVAMLLLGCSPQEGYVGFPGAQRVKNSPESVVRFHSSEGHRIETEAAASAVDVIVRDSLLIFSRFGGEYGLAAVDKNKYEARGAFLRRGRASGEVTDLIAFGNVSLNRDGDAWRMGYRDATNQWVFVDLLQSLSEGNPHILERVAVPKDFQNVFQKVYIGSGRFLGENLVDGRTRYERSIQGGEAEKEINPAMERLNQAKVESEKSGNAFDLLGTVMGYNPKLGRMVEASTYMNTIHLYDVEGSFSKTLYLGDRPDNLIEKLEEYEHTRDPREMFRATCVRVYPEYFAVMYYDHTLYLFDWTGKPLCEMSFDVPTPLFDLDLERSCLYTLDFETEAVWRFDLSSLHLAGFN